MSKMYDDYLKDHRYYVNLAWSYLKTNVSIQEFEQYFKETEKLIKAHDASKNSDEEYPQYDNHFYGVNISGLENEDTYNAAWLHHLHNNPHHWQYWILRNDDGTTQTLKMPEPYVLEMICDWWSFSFKMGKPLEIIEFYENNKDKIKLHEETRNIIERILKKITWTPLTE